MNELDLPKTKILPLAQKIKPTVFTLTLTFQISNISYLLL